MKKNKKRQPQLAARAVTMRPKSVIFDMDGTLVNVGPIRHHVEGENRNFDAFHRASVDMDAHSEVLEFLHRVRELGYTIVVLTARQAKYRDHTAYWLAQNEIESDALYMRATGDSRPDYEAKKDIYGRICLRYDVVHAVDDNPNVIRLWNELGLPVTDVGGWPDENGVVGPLNTLVFPRALIDGAPNRVKEKAGVRTRAAQ